MRKSLLLVVVPILAFCGLSNLRAATLDFEDVAVPPGSNIVGGDFFSGGFFFDSFGDEVHLVNGHPDYGETGSTFLSSHDFEDPLVISRVGGGTFKLNSGLFAEAFGPLRNQAENATSVKVTGNLLGGGTVTTSILLDGINDGLGGVTDFQSANFDASWDNLTSVMFEGVGGTAQRWAVDNISVNVPEPSMIALLGLGALALVGRRFCSKS